MAQQIDVTNPKFKLLKDIGSGSFGVAKLMRNVQTGELVAVKFIPRGDKINEYVERELINHRALLHPHIIQFKEVFLTKTHLAIVMEYASGGELFDFLCDSGRFSENEARYFFQQLISGLEYCHSQGVCHRDLKLENTLLDGQPAPRIKICDFGYSKHAAFDSQPKSIVGTRAYIAPEVILCKFNKSKYDGESADVWSCGVMLYLMLVGSYPFEDPNDPKNFSKTVQRIMAVNYEFPPELRLSMQCVDLIRRMLVGNPDHRITIAGIKAHPWFLKNLPAELQDGAKAARLLMRVSLQSVEELKKICTEAATVYNSSGAQSNQQAPNTSANSTQMDYAVSDSLDDEIDMDDLLSHNNSVNGGAALVANW